MGGFLAGEFSPFSWIPFFLFFLDIFVFVSLAGIYISIGIWVIMRFLNFVGCGRVLEKTIPKMITGLGLEILLINSLASPFFPNYNLSSFPWFKAVWKVPKPKKVQVFFGWLSWGSYPPVNFCKNDFRVVLFITKLVCCAGVTLRILEQSHQWIGSFQLHIDKKIKVLWKTMVPVV